jgi:hypothetical protein
VFQLDAAGGLVDVLPPLAGRADKLLLDILFPDTKFRHLVLEPTVLTLTHRKDRHTIYLPKTQQTIIARKYKEATHISQSRNDPVSH